MFSSVITGTGHQVPERVVTNDELAETCNTSDAWIRERTGIEERRYAAAGETATTLGETAARRALEAAGREPEEIDCIIFATLSPDYSFPGCGCLLQARLGVAGIPAFDVRNQCSGFLYGLQMADAFIRGETYERVLLVGAEVHSTGLDLSPEGRDVSVLFGDGAGAVVLERRASESGERGICTVQLGADGRHARDLWCEGPSSARHPVRITAKMLEEGVQYPQMRGRVVFRHAVQKMTQVIDDVTAKCGMLPGDLDLLVPHQANLRIAELVAKRLGVPPDRVATNIQRYGNTTAASIPLALDEYVRAGRINKGDRIALVAFGSGFTWGAAVVCWS